MKNLSKLIVVTGLFTASLFAAVEQKLENAKSESIFELSQPAIELGGSLGTPALANLLLGFHFPMGKISGFVRLSGMYHGRDRTNGLETELGIYFDTVQPFIQSVALNLSANDLFFQTSTTPEKDYFFSIGPAYEFNIKGFFLKAGVASTFHTNAKQNTNDFLVPILQAGYSVFLNY